MLSSNLQLGDCLELMKEIPDESIDFICCDPPYGTTSIKWDSVLDFNKMWEQYGRIIKPKGIICLFGSQPFKRESKNPEGYVSKRNEHGYGLKPVKGFENKGTR